ncbi:MAG: DUF748 domain-containing protein [Gallionella sp.]|nr:DUF748 domain-containing protein [Gallionella sp.]
MMLRLPSRKALALTSTGLILSVLLFSWLVLPHLIQSQAEKYLTGKTGHHLTMATPSFNPFELSLRLSGLRLTEPDGKPLLAFRELLVNLSAASLYRGALVFDNIKIDGLEATAVLLPEGKLNWSGLIAALQSPEKAETADAPLPRFDIRHFTLSGTRVDFTDNRLKPAFNTRIEPMDLELNELSSLPGDQGKFQLSATTSFGARMRWQGQVRLDTLTADGNVAVSEVNLVQLSGYFKDSLPVKLSTGVAGVATDYRVGYDKGALSFNLDHMSAKLNGVQLAYPAGPAMSIKSIEVREGSFDLAKNRLLLDRLEIAGSRFDVKQGREALALGSLKVDAIDVNLNSRQATVGRVALSEGHVHVVRNAQGKIDLLQALQTMSPPATTHAVKQEPSPWRYRLEKFDLAGFDAEFNDQAVQPAAKLAASDIALSTEGLSDDWKAAVPLKAAFKVAEGGNFAAEGSIVPALPSADIKLKLTDLSLKPAQPYLAQAVRLKLASGRLSTAGRVRYNGQEADYKGDFALRDLRLLEEGGAVFLVWKSLTSRSFEVTPSKLDISELTLDGLDTQLIINKDKTLSFKRILKPSQASAAPAKPSAFVVNLERLRFSRGEMDFADYSLALPFGTRIHALKGVVTGLSTRPDALGQLVLDGQVDDYGIARAVGKIDLMNPTDFTDIKVVFRNIEMARLTPYSATFAGRRITSGKLSLDLEYKIVQRQLQGKNQVVMDKLTLGEKVASPEAHDLPLDLAVSILQDSDGRIDLGLPISGSLDDPKFSYGGIIWQAISNVLSKIVTAPFRALGALFGGDDKFENIVFEAGSPVLPPPEREKLVRLAEVLTKRPGLSLAVQGVYADTDRTAIQDLQLRRTIAGMSGQHLETDEDPGPLAVHQPKVQKALESQFSDRLGGGELAAVKEGYRLANPGKLEQSTAGKMMSGLTGLFREKRTLSEPEIAGMKGVDFYAVLFERLRGTVVVEDKQLLALAASRGEATLVALKDAGAPNERLSVLAAEKVAAEGHDVPVKLVLGTAAKVSAEK